MLNEIFSKRLISARKQTGLSQDQLVARIGGAVKKTAIARYERGEMMPRPEVAELLAGALKQPLDYFYRTPETEITQVELRARASLGKREKQRWNEVIASAVERYLTLEQIMSMHIPFSNPLEDLVITREDDIEQAADQLHHAWQLGFNPLGSVMAMLEDHGIMVMEVDAGENFEGYSAFANRQYPIAVIRKSATTERRRFTALHELAHLMLKFDERLSNKQKENLCHRFAGAVLIPARVFHRNFGRYCSGFTRQELGFIKDKYGISAAAFIMRAANLNALPQMKQIELLRLVKKDKLERHIGSNQSTDNATRFRQLLLRAVTEGNLSFTKAAEISGLDYETFTNTYLNET